MMLMIAPTSNSKPKSTQAQSTQTPSMQPQSKHPSKRTHPAYAKPITQPLKQPIKQPLKQPSNQPSKQSSSPPTTPPTPHFLAETLEAMLILEHGAIKITKVQELLHLKDPQLLEITLQTLNQRYAKAKLLTRIEKLDDTLELRLSSSFENPVIQAYMKKKRKLSPALMETLAIIAYNQPVTKSDIHYIRGASSTNALKILLDTNLIETSGRKDAPGRPPLYRTTKTFLTFFAVKSLRDLPPLEDLKTYSFLKSS